MLSQPPGAQPGGILGAPWVLPAPGLPAVLGHWESRRGEVLGFLLIQGRKTFFFQLQR